MDPFLDQLQKKTRELSHIWQSRVVTRVSKGHPSMVDDEGRCAHTRKWTRAAGDACKLS
jgi:hypothetical protein